MANETGEERFGNAIQHLNSAETREDYAQTLNEFTSVIPALEGEKRLIARMFRGRCLRILGRAREAHVTLRGLLNDLESSPVEQPPFAKAARLELAESLRAMGRGREAIDEFLAVAPYFHDSDDRMSEGKIYRTVGFLWQELGEMGRAVESLHISRLLLENAPSGPLLLDTVHALGHAHYLAGDLERAIEIEEDALQLARKFDDKEMKSQLIHNLAEFSFTVQDYRRAVKYMSSTLASARVEKDQESVLRYLSCLGACYTETGAWRKAFDTYNEARQILIQSGREDSIMFGFVEMGRGQVLVDLKRFDEARPILARARELISRLGSETVLLDQIQSRLERETMGPLTVDCVHRAVQLALKGSTKGLSHSNPRPVVNLTDDRFLTLDLTDKDRAKFSLLADELEDDLLQTRYRPSDVPQLPDTMQLPLKFEYVDDVQEFEIKWNAFKQERKDLRYRADVQKAWDKVKERIRFKKGNFRGNPVELITYLSQLARVAQAYAGLNQQEGVREVCLHAADFVEIQSDDPMIAAAIWAIRLRLLVATHEVSDPGARELVRVEMQRCLDQEKDVFRLLDARQRVAALTTFVIDVWYEAARDALGAEGYASLVELVEDFSEELDDLDRIRHAIAVGSGDPARGTRLLDEFLSKVATENEGVRITLALDISTARATMRFQGECSNRVACEKHFGPFAPYLHREVRGWNESVFEDVPRGELISLGTHSVDAFTDGNLVVMKRDSKAAYVATLMHESAHQLFRAGQRLRTDDGRWLQVKRDIPTTSALTYLRMLGCRGKDSGSLINPGLEKLIEIGTCWAQESPELAAGQIRSVLRYFDDLGMQETAASYPSGAILVGMAYGLFGADKTECVDSYLHHLTVMDHDEAFSFGYRCATLTL